MKIMFLLAGVVLSISSKLLQFYTASDWGDFLVLPAATFFTLSVLLYNKTYTAWLGTPTKRRGALGLAAAACLSVLMFQLLTMVLFGRGRLWGLAFTVPLLLGLTVFFRLYAGLKKETVT